MPSISQPWFSGEPNTPAPAGAPPRERLIANGIWLALVALILCDIAWLLTTSLRISSESSVTLLRLVPTLLLCAWGSFRIERLPRLRLLCEGGLFMLIAWPALRLLNHLTMTTAFPLADAQLSSIDIAIGFDWHAYLAWFDNHPMLLSVMDFFYTSLSAYSAMLFIAIALFSRRPASECSEFIRIFFVTAVACCVIGQFFPALSAAIYYAPSSEGLQNIDPRAGAYHLTHLTALRENPDHMLMLANLPGLVTFPSFHTAMGIIAIYCCRSVPVLFAASLAINLLMIASTPIFGAHYLIDLAGGTIVALMVIVLQRNNSSWPTAEWRDRLPPAQELSGAAATPV